MAKTQTVETEFAKVPDFTQIQAEFSKWAGDFNKYGCDLVWLASERESGREVARGKTGIMFFDYTARKPAGVPPAFSQRFAG